MYRPAFALTAALAILLGACGGRAGEAPSSSLSTPSASSPPQRPDASTTVAGAAGPSGGNESLPVIHIGVLDTLGGASQILALDRGYFQQAGISAQGAPSTGGNLKLGVAALLSGQVDADGFPVDAGLLNIGSTGVKIVGSQARQDPGASASGLVVRKQLIDSGRVKTPADLKGLRIGIRGHGNASEFQVHKLLQAGGLPMSDVDLIQLDFPTMSSALAKGALDAGIFAEPFVTQLVSEGIGIKWRSSGDIVPGMQTTIQVFSPRLLANHDLAVRTMMALLHGARDYNDAFFKNINRQQVVQELAKDTALKDPKLYDQMGYAVIDPNGKVNIANVQDQLDWYTQMGYATHNVDLNSLYDPTIAQEAVARLGKYH